jgi:hypothetical protein
MNRVVINNNTFKTVLQELLKRKNETFVIRHKSGALRFSMTPLVIRCDSKNDFDVIYSRDKLEKLMHIFSFVESQLVTIEFYDDGVIGIKEVLV